MSCKNIQILNFNHNIVEVGPDNKIVITDQIKCNSITIPQPVTNILQINSPGPQGPVGPAGSGGGGVSGDYVTTSSFNAFTSSYNTFSGSYNTGSFSGSFTGSLFGTASWARSALTASYVNPLHQTVQITGSIDIQGSTGARLYFEDVMDRGLVLENPNNDVRQFIIKNTSGASNDELLLDRILISFTDVANIKSANIDPGMSTKPSGVDSTVVIPNTDGNLRTIVTSVNNEYADASGSITLTTVPTASYVNPLNQNVIITGSLTVSGSSTFTNIGPAIFSGSVKSNNGFTGSFSGSFIGDGSSLTNLPSQVGGNGGEVQYNNGGSFNGVSTLTYNSGTTLVTATNIKATGVFAEYVTTTTIGNTSPVDPVDTDLVITQSGTYIVTIYSTDVIGYIYFPDPTTHTGEKIRIQNRDGVNAADIGAGTYGRPRDINNNPIASIPTLTTKLFISNGTYWYEI